MVQAAREMVVESVRVHMLSSQHVVILREAETERYLPIWIGSWEAQSIAMRLQGVEAERPLTHDLLTTMLIDLGVTVRSITVSDLADETFRARIVLVQGGDDYEIDARPSDAIALAVRTSAPIFATEAVLDRAGVMPEADEDEKLSVFREFVNSLEGETPEGSSGPDALLPDDADVLGAPDGDDDEERPLDDRLGDEPNDPR